MNCKKMDKLANELATTVQDQYLDHGLSKWNMAHWFSTHDRYALNELVYESLTETWESSIGIDDNPTPEAIERRHMSVDCGTAACAGGWATAFFDELFINTSGMIEYDGVEGRSALCRFFGLTTQEADDLFLMESYPGEHVQIEPIDVAEKIRDMLESYDTDDWR